MIRKFFVLTTFVLFIIAISSCNSLLNSAPTLASDANATRMAILPTTILQGTLTPQPPLATPAILLASPTSSFPATATALAGDPRAFLGEPTYHSTFDDPNLWGLDSAYDDDHTRVEIRDNQLALTSKNAENWLGWRLIYRQIGNSYLEAQFNAGQCSGDDQYGLVFRSSSADESGFFSVTCDGRYSLRHFDGSLFTTLLDWKESSAIRSGSNQTNRLGVWVNGNQVRLFANGTLLADITDEQLSDEGSFGASIAAVNTKDFTVSVSEITYWDLK